MSATLLFLLLLVRAALAIPYDVSFCARYGVAWADAGYGEDYVTSPSASMPARGAWMTVERTSGSPVGIWAGWASTLPATVGCTPALTLDSTEQYRVKVYSKLKVGGNTLEVFRWNAAPFKSLTAYTGVSGWSPTADEEVTFTTTGSVEDWNIAAAGGYALWRDALGNSDETFIAYSQDCPGANHSCCYDADSDDTDLELYVSGNAYDLKYQIAHEFGHCVLQRRINGHGSSATAVLVPGTLNTGTTPGSRSCYGTVSTNPTTQLDIEAGNSHYFISVEYQAEAFWEGFANYYAVATFNNNATETDCSFRFYKWLDWNRDGTRDDAVFTPDYLSLDCADGQTWPADLPRSQPAIAVAGEDYLGANCTDHPTLANRGTEYDWVHFLWYLDVYEDSSPSVIADIFTEARTPDGGTPLDWNPTGDGSGAGYPAYELAEAAARYDSANSTSFYLPWIVASATYGVDR